MATSARSCGLAQVMLLALLALLARAQAAAAQSTYDDPSANNTSPAMAARHLGLRLNSSWMVPVQAGKASTSGTASTHPGASVFAAAMGASRRNKSANANTVRASSYSWEVDTYAANGTKWVLVFDYVGFSEAQAACQGKGGKLAVIRNEAENSAMAQFLDVNGAWDAWIGLVAGTDGPSTDRSQWVWSATNESTAFDGWEAGKPNNYNEEEGRCATTNLNGVWYDVSCDTALPYICVDIAVSCKDDPTWSLAPGLGSFDNCTYPAPYGQQCEGTCPEGIAGKRGATCSDAGTWSLDNQCNTVCTNDPNEAVGAGQGSFSGCADPASRGEQCQGTCPEGVDGNLTATCTDANTWTVDNQCTYVCNNDPSASIDPGTGSIEFCSTPATQGQWCWGFCAPGNNGFLAATCTGQDTWLIDNYCTTATCSYNPSWVLDPGQGSFNDCPTPAAIGDQCQGSCPTGAGGSLSATCDNTGTWVIDDQCGKAPPPNNCPGCPEDKCKLDGNTGAYKCQACHDTLVLSGDDSSQCACEAGKYGDVKEGVPACQVCPKGSFCTGGLWKGADDPKKEDCIALSPGLTTIGKRSTKAQACVNQAGYFFSLDSDGKPQATVCGANTYSPGLKKQRGCVQCPAGYTTNNQTGIQSMKGCVIPAGYYLRTIGSVAPCPKGQYRRFSDPSDKCLACAAGVTTEASAATNATECSELLQGYFAKVIDAGEIKEAAKCPQKFYCTGGKPTTAWDAATWTPSGGDLAGTAVAACPHGTWTEGEGAFASDACLTPPGHKTITDPTDGNKTITVPCANGEYRANWRAPSAASSCLSCGQGFSSSTALDTVTEYNLTTGASQSLGVATSTAACYIKAGQGSLYSTATDMYRAVNCENNTYGVAANTYGLLASPCRSCPVGTATPSPTTAPSSNIWSSDGAGRQGFTSPDACRSLAGYGFSGSSGVASQCPKGSYNPAGSTGACLQCPPGTTTSTNPEQQASAADCFPAAGSGLEDGVVVPCAAGSYRDANSQNRTCQACPAHTTTQGPGSTSADDCNMLAPGWVGSSADSLVPCGGWNNPTYGPANRELGPDSQCDKCPAADPGFKFTYLGATDVFKPPTVAREEATSPADCLTRWSQFGDTAWQIGGTPDWIMKDIASLEECAGWCASWYDCQLVSYDVSNKDCHIWYQNFPSVWEPTGEGRDVVAFKALLAVGTADAASLATARVAEAANSTGVKSLTLDAAPAQAGNQTKAKNIPSGSYTFWWEAADSIGASKENQTGDAATSMSACLAACDSAPRCAAVAMSGVIDTRVKATEDQIQSCSLIYGNTAPSPLRSLTKTDVTRLTLRVYPALS